MDTTNVEDNNDDWNGYFEDLVSNDVLYCIFQLLYHVRPLQPNLFAPGAVCRRWRRLFAHPIQTFIQGKWNNELLIHPPTYYLRIETKDWNLINRYGPMNLQISSVTDNKKQEEFIANNLFLHWFKFNIQCNNRRIKRLVDLIQSLPSSHNSGSYHPQQLPYLCHLCSDETIIQAVDFGLLLPISTISNRLNDVHFCYKIVEKRGMYLKYVPEHLKMPQICKVAVNQDGNSIQFVPELDRTPEIIKLAVEQNGESLQYLEGSEITDEIKKLALQQNGLALRLLSRGQRSQLCEIALQENPLALRYVPLSTKGLQDLRSNAVSRNGLAIEYANNRADLYNIAARQNGNSLRFIPFKSLTKELCEIAVKANGESLRYVPEHLKTQAMYWAAVHQNGAALSSVPRSDRTKELCTLAMETEGGAQQLGFIPIQFRSEEICKKVLSKNGLALEFVPRHLKTSEICNLALSENGEALVFIETQPTQETLDLVTPNIKLNKTSPFPHSKKTFFSE